MPQRLQHIDILRGLAAFSVVLCHLGLFPTTAGVYLFFVISGFCIHLRYAKGGKPDFLGFWKRRWLRLYPAYIAAIVLFLLVYPPNFNLYFIFDLVSHLLMLHNFDNTTAYSMNRVFWTLAIEEQLYALYFLFLFLKARIGWRGVLILAFALRFAWFVFTVGINRYLHLNVPAAEGAFANWWIWILGALAVEGYYGVIKLPKWGDSLVLFVLFAAVALYAHQFPLLFWWIEPVVWGAAFFFLINRAVKWKERKEFAILSGLGLMSYSLYLTHEVITKMDYPKPLLILGSLLLGYAFYLLFEKPFIKKR